MKIEKNIQIPPDESMNIYAKAFTRIKYTGKHGSEFDKKHANKHLKIGETYTIDYTDICEWHTDVYLKEVPNEYFNSVHFENI